MAAEITTGTGVASAYLQSTPQRTQRSFVQPCGDTLLIGNPPYLNDYANYQLRAWSGGTAVASLAAESLVIPQRPKPWETWLVQTYRQNALVPYVAVPERSAPSEFGRQLDEIERVTGLSDSQVAETFPGGVTRETVNRWRNRSAPNPRPQNAHRVSVLLHLARRLAQAGIPPSWLHQRLAALDDTPFDLLRRGSIAEVRQAVEEIAARTSAEFEVAAPRIYRDSDDVPEDGDDEGTWDWDEG
jgi:hypothetical protein